MFLMAVTTLLSAKEAPFTKITNLKVQYSDTPLAVEDKNPVFSWQMVSSVIAQKQSAYQIIVTRPDNKSTVWNSGKVISELSSEISYNGTKLVPETDYMWALTVWDARGKSYNQKSRFETGLMNPAIEAWNGASWIGSNEMILDAASAISFEINTDFQIKPGSKAASVIFGANDFRLKDKFLNLENIAGENYIRFELDISGAGSDIGSVLNIYRVGYGKNDSPDIPYKIISKAKYPECNIDELITAANRNDVHNLSINVNASDISVRIDNKEIKMAKSVERRTFRPPSGDIDDDEREQTGPPPGMMTAPPNMSISNYKTGNNNNTYPDLNSIGFACRPGDEVIFSDYKVLLLGQTGKASNIVFSAGKGATCSIFEKLQGVTLSGNGSKITLKNTSDRTYIGYSDPSYGSLTMVRTKFTTGAGKKIAKAKMYISSMGASEVFINGKRMGNDWFTPGSSQFRETIGYNAYDITHMVMEGENSLGAILSPGWYTGYMTFSPNNLNFFGDTEALLSKLVLTYEDGTKDIIVSNPATWKMYKNGPVEYGSFFQGERYNARKEANISVKGSVTGWSTNEYNDANWKKAEIVKQRDWIKFKIVARYDQPVQVAEKLTSKKVGAVHSDDGHTYTYDMGVNMVGVPSVTIPEGWLKEGEVVILRYGEQLYPGFEGDDQEYIDLYGYTGKGRSVAGRILTESYRAALSTDFYTAKNSQLVLIQPSTTYRGYQYIQITIPGHDGPLPLENVSGLVLSSNTMPEGTYEATTSDGKTDKLVNQLIKNIQRSQLGNFFTIPTDCPQRNERMGWTGDAQAYSRTATYNADVHNFFRQWMVALRDDQTNTGGIGSTVPSYSTSRGDNFPDGTTWSGAVCMVPWQIYTQYGDKQIVRENMATMQAWLEGMAKFPFSDDFPHLSKKASGLADWLAVDSRTPSDIVNNAIYIYLMEVTSIMADAIGDTDYSGVLKKRHDLAKEEWNKCYVDPETGKTRTVNGKIIHSQSSYATPIIFNAFSDNNMKRAQDYLADLAANPSASGLGKKTYPAYTITTGFSGTPNILPALSRSGKIKEAYNMFTCTEYASWLYPVTKGATSVWERWNGYELAFKNGGENSMNSFNHFALGAVGQWMYEYQLGITNSHEGGEAGYKHFVLQPTAGANYTSLKGSFNSSYGEISSRWTADGNGNMTSYRTVVPANTSATLYLPVKDSAKDFKSIKGLSFVKRTTHNSIPVAEYELSSGSFSFTITGSGVTVTAL
jgi:alpha-L-rhamnosidase